MILDGFTVLCTIVGFALEHTPLLGNSKVVHSSHELKVSKPLGLGIELSLDRIIDVLSLNTPSPLPSSQAIGRVHAECDVFSA